MAQLIPIFTALNSEQIRSTRLHQYDDYGLLDVYGHFFTENDERAAAVLELILRSLDHTELVAYDDLYEAITEYAFAAGDWQGLLRWAYARLAYDEQHEQGANRILIWTQLADAHLKAGDLDTALALYARCLESAPNDLDAYEGIADRLVELGLHDLTQKIAERSIQVAGIIADAATVAYYQTFYDELAAAAREATGQPVLVSPDNVAAFQRALIVERDEFAPAGYAPPIDRLLAPTAEDDTSLHTEILAQGKVLAGDLIRVSFDPDLDQSPASRAAIDLLRQLHRNQTAALDELQHFLDHANGDWRPLLSDDFGKFGPYTTEEIEAVALDVTISVFVRSRAIVALRKRAEKLPAQRTRVVTLFRTLITRSEAVELPDEESVVAEVINEAIDLKATELYPEIEQAFLEDRVDPEIVSLQNVQEEWGLPVTPAPEVRLDGLHLLLECQKCGRTRAHFVQHIFLDRGTLERKGRGEKVRYEPYVMDREIVCPKCGARDRYHVGPRALLQIFIPESNADVVAALSGHPEQAKMRLDPRVKAAVSTAFSQPMHPIDALERYKMLILTHPKRAENHIRMGKVLRSLYRSAPALAAIRKGHELEPDNVEYCLDRAFAEHDLGDKNLARVLYDKVLKLTAKPRIQDESMQEAAFWARAGLMAMKRGQPSPWYETTFGAAEGDAPKAAGKVHS